MRRFLSLHSCLLLAAAVAGASCRKEPSTPKPSDVTTRVGAINVGTWSPHDGTAAPIPATTIGTARGEMSSNNMAATLANGQVLVAGGIAATTASTAVHRLTTSTENSTFSAAANLSGNARGFGALVALNSSAASGNGEALQVGGGTRTYPPTGFSINAYADANRWSVANTSWTPPGALTMTTFRYMPSSTLMTDGRVLIIGGHTGAGGGAHTNTDTNTMEYFNPATNIFSAAGLPTLGNARRGHIGALLTCPSPGTACAANEGKVWIAGGLSGNGGGGGAVLQSEIFTPGAVPTIANSAMLPAGRMYAAAARLPDGKILYCGGCNNRDCGGASLATCVQFDPANGMLNNPSAPGSMNTAAGAFSMVTLPTGKVLAVGGYNGTGATTLSRSELYDPVARTWSNTAGSLTDGRYDAAVALLQDGKVIIAGGFQSDYTAAVPINTVESYDPGTPTVDRTYTGATANAVTRDGCKVWQADGTFVQLANGTACDDKNACTSGETCQNGICGTPTATITCTGGNQCKACDPNPANAGVGQARCTINLTNGTACDDGTFCNGNDSCTAGACTTHVGDPCTGGAACNDSCNEAARNCFNPVATACATDNNVCTDDHCDGAGACAHTNNTAPCDDGVFCNGVDTCGGGTCGHAGDPCAGGAECNTSCNEGAKNCFNSAATACATDSNVCTDDFCNGAGTCAHTNNTAPCNDGVFCNGTDTCGGGTCNHTGDPCTGGAECNNSCNEGAQNCFVAAATGCSSDGNVCTDDVCNGAGSCAHTNNTAPCNDGNACTTVDTCNGGSCVGGSPVTCAASDQCHTAGTCNPANGACSNPAKADGASCDDGTLCTQTDTCQAGICTGGSPVTCAALDQCHTAGACNPSTGTCSNPAKADGASCNDGNLCTLTDACQAGVCTGSSAVSCLASDQCHTAGTCDPATGSCSNPVKADGASCNDGNLCTQADTCVSGVCTGANPVSCTALNQCHTAGACDPSTGVCSNPTKTDGTTCDDGDMCTQTDTCQAGVCSGGNPKTCTGADACHNAVCNPTTGACSNPNKPDGTACGSGCGASCMSGTCTAGASVVCTALDACHVAGTCDPTTGQCSNPSAADGTACNDNNKCTTGDACTAGTCAGTAVVCTASDTCHTAGTCDLASGTCSNPAATDGTACNDNNACTTTDTCQTGVCTGMSPVNCPAPDECHVIATCNMSTGTCPTPTAKADGAPCTGGTCQAGACTPTGTGGAGGSGGAGGAAGGAGGTGGASGTGGAAGGTTGAGGTAGGSAGRGGTGGGAGGTAGAGGTGGGAAGRGGTTGTAGASGTTGTGGTSGTTGTGGASGTTGTGGASGTTGTGGGAGGRGGTGGGTDGGATDGGAKDGSSDSGDGGGNKTASSGGCGCALGNASTPFTSVLAGLAFALAARRRRRR